MRIRVLGSAAGGGFPQWNCGCSNCQGLRSGSVQAVARRQESVAISADGDAWFLLNASPEIREQIENFPALWPRQPRHSPIAGIVLTNGDLDHCLGLLSLRESQPIAIYATSAVRTGFTDGNVLYRTLERFEGQATWRILSLGVSRILGVEDSSLSIVDYGKVIAAGTPAELISGVGGHHCVEFALDGEPKVSAELWRALPGVGGVLNEDGVVALTVEEPHQTIPALLALVERNNWRLNQLTTRQSSLEDVFVNLTGRHLRED